MSKSKVVDLEIGSDGTYSSKDTLNIKKISKLKGIAKLDKDKAKENRKYMMPSGVDEFLSGVDVGLDLVENIKIRALRILSLRD